jgi:hypothetical protein
MSQEEKTNSRPEDASYAVFAETNADDMETWLTFISKSGNEDHLNHLAKQFNEIDWGEAPEYTGMFALDTRGVSWSTARDMMMINLNTRYDPNKFDGPMQRVDFGFKRRDTDETKAVKVYEIIGGAHICDFLGTEDLDGCTPAGSEDDYSDYSDEESSNHSQKGEDGALDLAELPSMLGKACRIRDNKL